MKHETLIYGSVQDVIDLINIGVDVNRFNSERFMDIKEMPMDTEYPLMFVFVMRHDKLATSIMKTLVNAGCKLPNLLDLSFAFSDIRKYISYLINQWKIDNNQTDNYIVYIQMLSLFKDKIDYISEICDCHPKTELHSLHSIHEIRKDIVNSLIDIDMKLRRHVNILNFDCLFYHCIHNNKILPYSWETTKHSFLIFWTKKTGCHDHTVYDYFEQIDEKRDQSLFQLCLPSLYRSDI